jgi:hypothetical protein
MALVIKGSSSGQVTVDVPAAAGTNTLTIPASTGTLALTSQLAGTIVKIACDEITAESTGSGTFSNTGLEVSITPASASNKILLLATGSIGLNTKAGFRFTQDNTPVGIGDTPGSNTNRQRVSFKTKLSDLNASQNFVGSCILSPSSTSELTYRLQIEADADSTWALNRSFNLSNSDDVSHAVTSSYLYAIELDGSNTTIST